jgi:hypothetical protein
VVATAIAASLLACASEEAPRVSLPIVVDASALVPATTDLGYVVTISKARTALRDLQFTIGGETHASVFERAGRWLFPRAHAHPGHYAGGEITGELAGPVVIDWLADGAVLGQANLITGLYRGANFTFRKAAAADAAGTDPIVGHTAHLEGTATKEGRAVSFVALVDVDEGAQLVGAPFEQQIAKGTAAALGVRLLPVDPTDSRDTVWNGIDFFALANAEGPVAIAPGQEAHNLLRRALQVHDHYDIKKR